ncbi:MAG: hypothetical protein M3367_06905 [Acidobacteriota bacterium]|nr:hypothetical protein [Acidobacteriota bacterium]
MANRKSTFSEILKQTGAEHSKTLMAKARLANNLAKRARDGASRQSAYSAKAKALSSLVKNLPETVRVAKDIKLTDFVVVELHREQSGLHLPVSFLQGASV